MARIYGQKDWRHAYMPLPAEEARVIRLEFMDRLWGILEPLPLTDKAIAWLSDRGFDPTIAHALGFRDWRPAMTRLKERIEALSPPERVATGFFFKYGSMWWPICDLHRIGLFRRSVSSSENMPIRAEGLVAPVWEPEVAHPTGWLWQVYEPIGRFPADNCMRQVSAEQPTLVGLGLGASGLPPPGSHKNLLIGEGPMDWLALTQAAAGRAATLGMLRTIHLWQPDWTRYLEGAERLVLVLPDRKGYAAKVFAAMKECATKGFGSDWKPVRLELWTMEGEGDCQERLKSGELAERVEGL